MEQTTFVVSDIHLGAVPDATERAFLCFLDHVAERADRLILAGDLFDFWFEWGGVIPGRHFRTLAALADVVDAGVDVMMVGGNHDAWGGDFLRDEVGIDFHADSLRTELAGRPALVTHGDGVGAGDLKYRALKTVIRSRFAVGGFRALHPELGVRLADAVSSTEGKVDPLEAAEYRSRMIRAWAEERLAADSSLGWVVCGHAHLPAVHRVAPGRYYLNAGDWVQRDTYIEISPDGKPELRSWTDQAAES